MGEFQREHEHSFKKSVSINTIRIYNVNWRVKGKNKENKIENQHLIYIFIFNALIGYYSNCSNENHTKFNIESINSTLIAAALLNPLLLPPQIRKRWELSLILILNHDFFSCTSFPMFLFSTSPLCAPLVAAISCLLLSPVFELQATVPRLRLPEPASSSKRLLRSASSSATSACRWSSSMWPLH